MGETAREAFDLHHPACRKNFKRSLKYNWKRLWLWKLVFSDTLNRVCTKPGGQS
jgi:hypothetical protein